MIGYEDAIRQVIREWPQWSAAERRGMDRVEDEILSHCRNGNGNAFIKSWCERILAPALKRMGK